MSTRQAILAEIRRAFLGLGSRDENVLANISTKPTAELYAALEVLGAHPYLLAIVNSWGDGQNDAETLAALEAWNAGTFKVEMIASSGKIPRP